MTKDELDLLENILDCFCCTDETGRYEHQTLDGVWVPVSEDLQDYLEQADTLLKVQGVTRLTKVGLC